MYTKTNFYHFLSICAILLLSIQFSNAQKIDSLLVKPYLQHVTQNNMTILWETTSEGSSTVEYGEALLHAKKPNLSKTAKLKGTRTLHEIRLENLKPATKYLYRVRTKLKGSKKELISEVYTFSTAVNAEDAFYFAFIGDTQQNSQTPWAWARIAKQIYGKRPNFIVHAGDLVDDGNQKFHWTDRFFKKGQKTLSRYPMFTTLGNHENDSKFYYDYMANPEPEYYYTVTYGNAQFFFVDTNREVGESSEQYLWLEGALANSKAKWKFVVHHHPPYSTEENDHGDGWIGLSSKKTHARDLVPLYETYGVDFCLFGHTHVYERTWPIFKDAVNIKKGVIYINSGGAGGGLEDLDPVRSWFTREVQGKKHHYCTFAIYDDYLSFNAIDTDNNIFDSFELTKKNDKVSFIQPPAPLIKSKNNVFMNQVEVTVKTRMPAEKTYYTTDGSEPTQQSVLYKSPITLKKSAELKVRSYSADGRASRTLTNHFEKQAPLASSKVGKLKKGVSYKYYEGSWRKIPDFSQLKLIKSGISNIVTDNILNAEINYGLVYEGYFYISETEVHTLYIESDDGSKLYVNDKLLVDNDGNHAMRLRKKSIALSKGWHRFKIEFYQGEGGKGLRFGRIVNGSKKIFFPSDLGHK